MNPLSKRSWLAFSVAAAVGACAYTVGTHAQPSDYDQTCTVDGDCVAVWEKSCEDPGCNCEPVGAVNQKDATRFKEDEDRVRCLDTRPGAAQCDCVAFEAFCSGGKCATRANNFTADAGP